MKKILSILIISLLTIIQSITFAGGGLSTRSGTDAPSGGGGGGRGMTYGTGATGTRYVLRIDKKDIGGINKDEYYIIHFNEGNKAVIGYGCRYPQEYSNPFNKIPDSNEDISHKYDADDGKYRLVTKWFGGKICTDNFGLREKDVNTLIAMIENHAKKIGDYETLDQIAQVEDGNARLEIRAEIVFSSIKFTYVQGWLSWSYYQKLGDIAVNISGKDMRTFRIVFKKGQATTLPAVTYREGIAIRNQIMKKINEVLGTNYSFNNVYADDCLCNSMADVPRRLYEKDKPYVTEEYATDGNEINEGWDYIKYEATGVTIRYKDIDTKKEIIEAKYVTLLKKQKYEYEDLTRIDYTYTGILTLDSDEQKAKAVTIRNDKKEHEIIFWYKREYKKIKVKYRDYNDGTPLIINKNYDYGVSIDIGERRIIRRDLHPTIENVHQMILDEGYEYKGVQLDFGKISSNVKTYQRVTTDNDFVTFYYVKKEIKEIDIRYREWNGTPEGELIEGIETKYDTTKEIFEPIYIVRSTKANSEILSNKYVYKGFSINEKCSNNEIQQGKYVYVTMKDNIVTFWYRKEIDYAKIRVIGVYQPTTNNYGTQHYIYSTRQEIPTYDITCYPDWWEGYQYKGIYKVFYGTSTYNGNDENCISGWNVTIPEMTDDTPVNDRTVLVVFYYMKEKMITVYYKDIEDESDILDMTSGIYAGVVTITRPIIDEYVYMGVENILPTPIPRREDVSITAPDDGIDYVLIFWYKKKSNKPKLIYGVPDPNEEPVENYDELKDKIKDADTNGPQENNMIYANELNNQYIYKDKTNKIWVLDEEGKLIVRFATSLVEYPRFDIELVFPFNVEYEGKSSKVLTIENVPVTDYQLEDEEEYIGYQAEIEGIRVPIDTLEKNYDKEIYGSVIFRCDELGEEFIKGTERMSITIIGAVYDFKITNIDGSEVTGDSIWKKSLFLNTKEYDASILPVGQGNEQQNEKYNFGIKLGTRFYFSLNTKGQRNNQIEIKTKYFFYNKDGKCLGEVLLRDSKGKIISSERKTSTKDENRMTDEYKMELIKGQKTVYPGMYSDALPSIGTLKKINISTRLRMPFVNYGVDNEKYDESSIIDDNTIKNVSHWYADYFLPNNSYFYSASSKKKITEEGYVVICFCIKTIDYNGNYYLAYNFSSPFNQYEKESEWIYEKGYIDDTFILPNKEIANGNFYENLSELVEDGYAPVFIYQTNISTVQNLDSVGTH